MKSKFCVIILSLTYLADVHAQDKGKGDNIFSLFVNKKSSSKSLPTTVEKPLLPNIREQCRVEMAGMYIDTLNTEANSKLYIESGEIKQKELVEAKKLAERRLKKAIKKRDRTGYDLKTEREVLGIQEYLKLIDRTLADNSISLVRNKARYKNAIAEKTYLEGRLKTVFVMKEYPHNGGFRVKVEYQHKCGAYEYLCPLPPKFRRSLGSILTGGETPVSCERYSQISPIKRISSPP